MTKKTAKKATVKKTAKKAAKKNVKKAAKKSTPKKKTAKKTTKKTTIKSKKTVNYTEKEISAKAFDLYNERIASGIVGSSESDWFAAVEYLQKTS